MRLHHLTGQHAVDGAVVHHQKTHREGLKSGDATVAVDGLARRIGTDQRQLEPKARAHAGLAVNSDLTTQQFHQMPADGQAQTVTAIDTGGVIAGLLEAFENFVQAFGPNADAGVAHRKHQLIGLALYLERDLALVGELDGVAQQINQYLHQAMPVTQNEHWQIRVGLQAVNNVHAVDPLQEQVEGGAHRDHQLKRFVLHFQLTALQQ